MKLRAVKTGVDWVLLQIPLLRATQISLDTVLFFSTFRLAYEAGGLGVLTMFDLSCQTIRNSAFRQDFLKARHTLNQNGSFADAFEQLTLLEDEYKGLIATGSVGGQLDQSLTQLVAAVTQQIEFKLQIFNNVFQRMVSYSVAMSIVGTVLICTAS